MKNSWSILPLLLLVFIVTALSCNRNALKQTEALSPQEQLKKKNQQQSDSLKKVYAETYWYLNPNNTWLQERARGVGGGCIGLKEDFKTTPNELLNQHKEHLGYLPEDEFVEVRRFATKYPTGFDIHYERYYKDIYVLGENLRIYIGTDGYVNTVCARFYPFVEKMYKPAIVDEEEAKKILLTAFREKLSFFSKNIMDSVLKTDNGIVYKDFRLSFAHLPNGKFDLNNYDYGYSTILHIPGLKTAYFDALLDAITGEVKRMKIMGVHNANIPVCTNHYGNQNLDAEFDSQVSGIDYYKLLNIDRKIETRPFANWNEPDLTTPNLPNGPNCGGGCATVGIDFCDTQTNTSMASAQWAAQKAYDYIINSLDLQDGIYKNSAFLPNDIEEVPISIANNIDLPLSYQGTVVTATIPKFPEAKILNLANDAYIIIAPPFKSSNIGLFGPSPTSWKQLNTLDVLGHEMTHAFLNYTNFSFFSSVAKLNNPIGDCFDEAVCDIWGALIEQSELGNDEKVWIFFDDNITTEKKLGRSMKNPNSYYTYNSVNFNTGQPDYYKQNPYWNVGFSDIYINLVIGFICLPMAVKMKQNFIR